MTNQWPDKDNRSIQGIEKFVTWLALIVLLLLYWGYIWLFERVNYLAVPPGWWMSLSARYPLFDVVESFILVLAEFFSFGVLRHFIPVFVAAWLARWAVHRFLTTFYALPVGKDQEGKILLNRLRAWNAPSSPSVYLDASTPKGERRANPVLTVGGPARIAVERGSAIVTEVNGHMARVLGPGSHFLARFEYPYQIIDLRPQDRQTEDASMMTRDGITVTASLGVTFHIASDQQLPSHEVPFPFDPASAREAAYAQSVSDDGKVNDWKSASLGAATAALTGIVADSRLDELAHPTLGGVQPYPSRNREMRKETRETMAKQGVTVTDTRLGRLELPAAVLEKYLEYWRVYWEKKRRLEEVEGRAALLEEAEKARARANALVLQAIVEGLQQAKRSGPSGPSKQAVAVRLIEALQEMAQRSQDVSPAPDRLLAALGSLRQQLLQDGPTGIASGAGTEDVAQAVDETESPDEPAAAPAQAAANELRSSGDSNSPGKADSVGEQESTDT